MKRITTTAAALLATTSLATAGGLDRAGNNLGPIFEDGTYAEFSFGSVNPTLSGTDAAIFGGRGTTDVAQGYSQGSFGFKSQINDKLSFALSIDQPYGADVRYQPTGPTTGSVALGGTFASVNSVSFNGTFRYKFENGFSVHGGMRAQTIEANVALAGAAYGPLNGYTASLASDMGFGYHAGVAYERPDIALRVALTYFSEVDHSLSTTENINPGAVTRTNVTTPEALNLDFQTGIAENTLLFGSIRRVDWSSVRVTPAAFGVATAAASPTGTPSSLVGIEDTTSYSLGIGRRFNDKFSGAISVQYEKDGNPLVSPLGPSTGRIGVTVGGTYTHKNMKLTGGINYTKLGDAQAATSNTARASFTGGKSIGVGLKVGYSF